MDIYPYILECLIEHPSIRSWPEMRSLVARAVAPKPPHWNLPILACEALGMGPERALPAATAIACLQSSIILIDDMLDEDPRGEHLRVGNGAAANMASAFQAIALEFLSNIPAGAEQALSALHSLNRMILDTSFGQYLDIQNPSDEAAYWQLIRKKSSPFFGAALEVGALVAGASLDIARQFKELGYLYGEIVQIHDDLNDTMAVPASPDWTAGRSPLPIIYAQRVNHPDRERFLQLRSEVLDTEKLEQAQSILVRCGAVSYCLDQILSRYDQARGVLAGIPQINATGLEAMLDMLVLPVRDLFGALSASQNES